MRIVFCAVIFGLVYAGSDVDWPVVSTAQGKLRGSVIQSLEGRKIFSFRGIPYALAPVGELRFKPPVKMNPWTGIRNATKDGFMCPQRNGRGPTSEDCLFLNVYTTRLPDATVIPNRSVIVFFHPGGFFSMGGSSALFGPQYLLDEPVVLVTSNYRLGALGFLSTGDSVVPGNNGLKDQVQVLRWVNENIASFGGNPESVTIVGYSAGSRSVYLHMVSPMSKGLFHKAATMSAGFQRSGKLINPLSQAEKQARLLNCPYDSSKELVACLRTKAAQEIADSLSGFREWGFDPMVMYNAVIEPDLGNSTERFLTDDPAKLFISRNFTHVPLIIGTTKDEFNWKALQVLGNSSWAEDMSTNFEKIAPISFMYERDSNKSRYISQELKKFYLNNEPITNKSEEGLGHLYSDSIVIYQQDEAAKLLSKVNREPVYYYQFTFPGRFSFVYKPTTKIPYGVSHHDDLMYLFHISFISTIYNKTDPEYPMIKRMTKMWSLFAATGNPTPTESELGITWEKLCTRKPKYLEIGSELIMHDGLYYQNRSTLWERLLPLF